MPLFDSALRVCTFISLLFHRCLIYYLRGKIKYLGRYIVTTAIYHKKQIFVYATAFLLNATLNAMHLWEPDGKCVARAVPWHFFIFKTREMVKTPLFPNEIPIRRCSCT